MREFTDQMFMKPLKSIHQMRRDILILKKKRNQTVGEVKSTLRGMLRGLKMLDKDGLKRRNLLTNSLLKLNTMLMDIPCHEESDLHKLFELWVNCLKTNFQNFVSKDGMEWHIKCICDYICDLIMVNSTSEVKTKGQPAYMKHIQDHRITHEIARHGNKERVQLSLYYLIQMVVILLEVCDRSYVKIWSTTERLKLQSFVLFNKDSHLITLFVNKTRRLHEGFFKLDNFE